MLYLLYSCNIVWYIHHIRIYAWSFHYCLVESLDKHVLVAWELLNWNVPVGQAREHYTIAHGSLIHYISYVCLGREVSSSSSYKCFGSEGMQLFFYMFIFYLVIRVKLNWLIHLNNNKCLGRELSSKGSLAMTFLALLVFPTSFVLFISVLNTVLWCYI
jgi:hypothetical protein